MLHFVAYSLAALTLVLLLNMGVNRWIEHLFSQVDLVSQYSHELRTDAFGRIPEKKLNGVQYVVYDEAGTQLHVQGEKLQSYLQRLNRNLILEYDRDSYLQSFPYWTAEGELWHMVARFRYDGEAKDYVAEEYALFDTEYRQTEGNLLENGEKLSPEDIRFIGGEYADFTDIFRYDYKTNTGEKRTLISMTSTEETNRYDRAIALSQKLWLTLIPVLLLLIFMQSLLFGRTIRKSIKPLDDAIVQYGKGNPEQLPDGAIPEEFTHVWEHFRWMSRELDSAKAETEREQQERQRYIAGITHDLSTPLTAILGYSKAICDGKAEPEKEKTYLKAIYRKAELCQELMQNFFEYTKLEHPDRVIQRERTDLGELLRQYLIEKMPEIELYDFCLEPEIPEEPVFVQLDRNLLLRGLDNLMNNALKYNDPGTTVFVSLHREDHKAILTVADNGKGIPEELQADIFRPFVTGNTARTPGKGTGFGMAVSRKAVELHGGTIALVNPPAPGTCTEIRITLPI